MDNKFSSNAKDIIELLEASHLSLEDEIILDDAKMFAKNWLKDAFISYSINIKVVERVVHALELPSHWRVPWFDLKWHVKQYQANKDMDHVLLELTKLNFNITQAKLQKEVKELSRYILLAREKKSCF